MARQTKIDAAIAALKEKVRIFELAIAELEKQRVVSKAKTNVARIRRDTPEKSA